MKNQNEIEKVELETQDYKEFSKFWEKARNITDETGDNFLTWDNSNMCHLSFSEGYQLGSLSKEKEMLDDEIKFLKMLFKRAEVLSEDRLFIQNPIAERLQKLKGAEKCQLKLKH